MKLSLHRVHVSARTAWWIVELDAPSGVGFGECSDGGTPAVLLRAVARLSEVLRGRDVIGERDAVLDEMAGIVTRRHGAAAHAAATAMGGIEQALVDLAAQDAGVPLWRWLGADDVAPIPLYANINRAPGSREPEAMAAVAVEAQRAGFGNIKCAPFDIPVAGQPLAEAGVDRLRAVCAALGDAAGVFVDFHERLTWAETLTVIKDIEPLGIQWIEDVVPVDAVDRLVELRSMTRSRIAGGEMLFDAGPARAAVDKGVLDVLMPDVKHAGGVLRARALVEALPEVAVSPHNPSGPVATLAAAHLLAATPRADLLEHAFGEVTWRSDIVGGAERIDNGHLHLPVGPGLGAPLDTTHPAVKPVWTTHLT